MNIFQISQELQDIFNELEDNGGELTDELEARLTVSQQDFKTKVKNYGEVIKQAKADIKTIDEELARLKSLKDSKNKAIDRLSKVIAWAISMYGEETKSGGKFVDFGSGKISVRNSTKVEIDTERTDDIANSVVNYIGALAYSKELYGIKEINVQDLIKDVRYSDDIEFNTDELANIPASFTFDVNLNKLLDENGISFMQKFFEFVNTYKVKSNVSKTVLKSELEDGTADLSKIAHIVENKTITIK